MIWSMSIDTLYFFKIKPLNYYDSVAFNIIVQHETNKSSKKRFISLDIQCL